MSNRNSYRNWSAEEIRQDASATWKRAKINGVLLSTLIDPSTNQPIEPLFMDFEVAKARLGLKLAKPEITYALDAEGQPIVKEDGTQEVESINPPPYDLEFTVKAEGLTDCEGTTIPKGKQYFTVENQANNRQIIQSHVNDLMKRLGNWAFTLEPLIKDENGDGQNEQHRCAAVCGAALTGSDLLPQEGIPIITLDGCSVGAAGAIDTGKQKSATDDLTSDHEILSPTLPLTLDDFRNGTDVGYGKDMKQMRQRILRETQGAAKRTCLRMSGVNIKGSKFSGYDSAGNVVALVKTFDGFDEMVNLVYAYINAIPAKVDKRQQRPVKVWEVATAYACYLLRNSAPLQSIDQLTEYEFPAVDLEPLQAFLEDVMNGATMQQGPLAEWCKDRVSPTRLKDTDESSFAQVCMALEAHLKGEPVTAEINQATVTGKQSQNGQKFFHFGGGDKGPAPKKKKGE